VMERRRALVDSLAALERRRGEQLKMYQIAHRERRMLSNLLEQQRDEWEQEQARAQQKIIDDLFASRRQRGWREPR